VAYFFGPTCILFYASYALFLYPESHIQHTQIADR